MRGGGLAYFADFVCRERRLVIELDGSQHADSEYDRVRDAFMAERGCAFCASGTTKP
jgi:very-short-patch-repair endonuclease